MKDRHAARAKPRTRSDDMARVLSARLSFMVLACVRRWLGYRRRPAWSFGLEVTIAAYRGSWSAMPELGIVRWRNVGELMSHSEQMGWSLGPCGCARARAS